MTLVLAGIRAPKTARNESEKSEPYGPEAAAFATHRYMQRDVEIEFDAVDKSGGFIGAMFLNRTENAAITLVKEGLASVHGYSAEGLSWSKQLLDAEAEAKTAKNGVSIQCLPWMSTDSLDRCGRTTRKKKQNLSQSMKPPEKWNTLTSSSAMSEQMTLAFQSKFSIPKVHPLPPMVLRKTNLIV